MKTKKGQVSLIVILILLIAVLVFLAWFLYQNIPGSPEELKAIIQQPKLETGNLSYEVKQFHPNMKFNHNSISYKIEPECDGEKRERMTEAFAELADRLEVISFYENSVADIEVSCSEKAEQIVEEDFFIAGEGGARGIIQTKRYNIITNGTILLYGETKGVKCEWPNVELHELLHVFGFTHSEDKNSLMYPKLESCSQKLDESIINDLKELYSQENLPDLYFEEVIAIKKGRYLDFNVTVKNSGTINAENVILTVLDDSERIEDFDLENIAFGAGITFQVSNLKLRSRSSENIELRIDSSGSIKEIDKENNLAKLEFS